MHLSQLLFAISTFCPFNLCTESRIEYHNPSHQCLLVASKQRLPDLVNASIDDLAAFQANGLVTSVQLVQACLHRISEVNHLLCCVGEINPDALSIAQQRGVERAAGHSRGPLHGIPVLIKDNIPTLDRMNNTAGSFALLGAIVHHEATVVSKLRQAGAVILGKTTMGEWAQMRSMFGGLSHGWSAYGGQCVGPYHAEQDPSGSSSGSGVAIALALASGALATETSGSILLPAEKSNLVGIKPTLGLTSRNMVIPISLRQDTVGPFARTVKDTAHLLSATAGKDKADNWTNAQPFEKQPDYVKACKRSAFQRARIGVPRNGINPYLDNSSKPIMDAFEDTLEIIHQAGATVVDGADFAVFNPSAFNSNSDLVLDVDFVEGLESYLSQLATNPNDIHNLRDLIDFSMSDPREEYPERDISVWQRAINRNLSASSSESYNAYEANRRMAEENGITGTLERYDLDALIMPTFTSFRLPAIAGLPVITVPLGFFPAGTGEVRNTKGDMVNVGPGIPFGISFVGAKWSEETLIGFAYAFEQRTMVRERGRPVVSPRFELSDRLSGAAVAFESSRLPEQNVSASSARRDWYSPLRVLKKTVYGLSWPTIWTYRRF